MTRLGRMELIGPHAVSAVEKMRAVTVARRETIISNLRTKQTELAERVDFFRRHKPAHPQLDETCRRLAAVTAEIEIQQQQLAELRTIGAL